MAYAAHEETGDDLRRRWDDPELEKIGEHPVAYVCAGSHATRYFRGEYLTELAFPLPRAISAVRRILRRFWYVTLRQYADEDYTEKPYEQFTIPFVDYGRGDGLSVGPGQDREWDPSSPHEPGAIVDLGLSGAVGPLHPGPLRGRGRPGGPDVRPRQDHQPRVVRPRGLGRARQGADPGRRTRNHQRTPGGARRKPGSPPLRTAGKEQRAEGAGHGRRGHARPVPPEQAPRETDAAHRRAIQRSGDAARATIRRRDPLRVARGIMPRA